MNTTDYQPFGNEFKAELMKWTKKDLVEKLAKEMERVHFLSQNSKHRNNCHHYLMSNCPKDITLEGTLLALGYQENGLSL